MKKIIFIITCLVLISWTETKSQTFVISVPDTFKVDTLGSDMIYPIFITNISSDSLTIFLVRKEVVIPPEWTAPLCFEFCLPPEVDSIATTPEFSSHPLSPNEMREASAHFFPYINHGTGMMRIEIGNWSNPSERQSITLRGSTIPTSVNEPYSPNRYSLEQNYPNPFNPSTIIRFSIPESERVSLKVIDLLGKEKEILNDQFLPAGSHEILLDSKDLSSGVYLYQIRAGNFIQTRKMILEK